MVSSLGKKLEKVDLAQMGLARAEVALADTLVTKLHTDVGQANMLVWELSACAPEGQNITAATPAVSLNTVTKPAHFPQVRTETCGNPLTILRPVTSLQTVQITGGNKKVSKGITEASNK